MVVTCGCLFAGALLWCGRHIWFIIAMCFKGKGKMEGENLLEQISSLQLENKKLLLELAREKDAHERLVRQFGDLNSSRAVDHAKQAKKTIYFAKFGHCWHADRNCSHIKSSTAVSQLVPCTRCVY